MKPVEASTKPLRADAARNQRLLLAAAREAFTEEGFDVSVDEIARRAGVGKGTVYRRYATKEALAWAALDEVVGDFESAARRAAEHDDTWVAFREFIAGQAIAMAREGGFFETMEARLLITEDSQRSIMERALAACQIVLDRAIEAGVVRADLLPEDISAMLKMVAVPCKPRPGIPVTREAIDRYLALVLEGAKPRKDAEPLPGVPPTWFD